MWIAKTSFSDGIAIVVFATALFLILFTIVKLAKWTSRLFSGKPRPVKMETVIVVLESGRREEKYPEEAESIGIFASYLHSKLAEESLGTLEESYHENQQWHLNFEGPDATRIWETISNEVRDFAPKKPECVILERSKKKGERQILSPIPWHPGRKLDYQPEPPAGFEIPERWTRLSGLARNLTMIGLLGLFGWNLARKTLHLSENDFRDTMIGNIAAWLAGVPLVLGLLLTLVCSIRIRNLTEAAGFDSRDSPMSDTLKYVLLVVVGIFGIILLLVWSE